MRVLAWPCSAHRYWATKTKTPKPVGSVAPCSAHQWATKTTLLLSKADAIPCSAHQWATKTSNRVIFSFIPALSPPLLGYENQFIGNVLRYPRAPPTDRATITKTLVLKTQRLG